MTTTREKIQWAIVDRFWGIWYGVSTLWNARRRHSLLIVSSILSDMDKEPEFPELFRIDLFFDKDGYGGAYARIVDPDTGETKRSDA